MDVLVTGADGALGRTVVKQLLGKDFYVVVTDLNISPGPYKVQQNLAEFNFDLRSDNLSPCFQEAIKTSEVIIHTGAIVDISAPAELIIKVNSEATKKIINAINHSGRKNQKKQLIFISSASVYEASKVYLSETSSVNPTSPYEESKLLAEDYIKNNLDLEKASAIILRPGLIYGPRAKHLGALLATIPPLIREFTLREIPSLVGGPSTNWIHVEDLASAILLLTGRDKGFEVYNVCENSAYEFSSTIIRHLVCYDALKKWPKLPSLTRLDNFYLDLTEETICTISNNLNKYPLLPPINLTLSLLWKRLVKKYDLRPKLLPKIDKAALVYLKEDIKFSNEKLRNLNWNPSHSINLPAATLRWYIDHRWIP